MKSFAEDAKRLFGTDNLYDLLGVESDSSQTDLKRAFYKCSLKYHPDRHNESKKSLATEQFQIISQAFSILSDEDSRAAYDETGIIGESFSEKSFKDWVDYFNLIFPKFTKRDYDEEMKKYIGSEKERDDIAKAYERYEGDMDKIMETVLFADCLKEDRIRNIIRQLIDEKKIKPYAAFIKESAKKRANRLKRAQRERAEFERNSKRSKDNGEDDASMDSLILAIQNDKERRQAAADSFIDQLAAKYCKPEKKRQSTRKSVKKGR
ncbi:hypothetical protein Aperf_G00000079485 [Anoplocephala perfoliata]